MVVFLTLPAFLAGNCNLPAMAHLPVRAWLHVPTLRISRFRTGSCDRTDDFHLRFMHRCIQRLDTDHARGAHAISVARDI
jgi:hypothetical protein